MAPIHSKSILLLPFVFITVLIVSLSISVSTAIVRDSITPTQPLADNETLVSAGGTFALGFFTPNNSERRYIGIWYNNITVQTVVWVANRANPVIRSTGQLSVTATGTVTITNRDSTHVVWSSLGLTLTNPVVQLLDTGNFVVKEEGDNTQKDYLWQSFDYPTDTLLPGMKLGVDKVAGLSRNLTAWKSEDDPSPGEYCAAIMVIGHNSPPEVYLFNRSSKVWRSGPGESHGGSNGFNYSIVNNYKEMAYSFVNQVSDQTILRVGQSGVLQFLTWVSSAQGWSIFWQRPTNLCDNIGHCGSYSICDITESPNICRCLQGFAPKNPANWDAGDYNDGCGRRVELDCREGTSTDTFLSVNGVKFPEYSILLDNLTSNLYVCRSECLENCSCTAYAFISGGGGGCVIWVTDLLDVSVQNFSAAPPDLYIRNGFADTASHSQVPHQKANRRIPIVTGSLLSGALLLVCFILFLWIRMKRRRVILGRTIFFSDKLDEDDGSKDLDLPLFNFGIIAAATEYFLAENKLGQGGFGPVYKGMLGGDKEIAVKRLAKSSQQGVEEFKNEVILIAKLQSRNLVRLLGCCIHGEERMLIYEYMPNKSLDTFLFVGTCHLNMLWKESSL